MVSVGFEPTVTEVLAPDGNIPFTKQRCFSFADGALTVWQRDHIIVLLIENLEISSKSHHCNAYGYAAMLIDSSKVTLIFGVRTP